MAVKSTICSERVAKLHVQERSAACVFANQTKLLLSLSLAKAVTVGDEITFPIPESDAVGRKYSSPRNSWPDGCVTYTKHPSDTSASLSRTNEVSTSSLPRFSEEALASDRSSCLATSCASTSTACQSPTGSRIPPSTKCAYSARRRHLNFAWLSSCVIWSSSRWACAARRTSGTGAGVQHRRSARTACLL